MENENIQQQPNPNSIPPQTPAPSAMGIPVKTIALVALLAFIACVLVYIAVSPKKTSPSIKVTTTVEKITQDTTLSIAKTTPDPKDPAKYYSDVYIDTGKNKVNAVQIELSFDPTQLKNVDISAGDFFSPSSELLKKIDSANGLISYAISVPTGQSSVGGNGVVARISYSPVSLQGTTITTINFRPKTEVSSLEESGSLLKDTNDGVVEIQVIAAPTSASSSAQ